MRITREDIVKKLENQDSGWEFVSFVAYETYGKCQVTGARLKNGVKMLNPVTQNTFVVAEDVAIKHINDIIIPRQKPENTVIEEPRPFIPKQKEPKIPQKRGPKPGLKAQNRPEVPVESGLNPDFLPDVGKFTWIPTKN